MKMARPKKDAISILIKKKVIDDVEAGLKYEQIINKYGLKSKSNVSQTMKNKQKWLVEKNKDISPFCKTIKITN